MKELSIEEKAKAYDEALERAEKALEVLGTDKCEGARQIFSLFPELKESEDERIRKTLIRVLNENVGNGIEKYGAKLEDALAWLEKQGSEPNWCHHKVDLSNCSEEYRKAYYDGWNNCNQQHSQCKSEWNDVVKCLINGMKFYYEDNEEATWGTEKFSMKVKDILAWLENQCEQKSILNIPSRDVILSIWDLGNEWKELTNGCISTEYGTQLDYIQKHWHESEYYLKEKQREQKFIDKVEPKFKVGDWVVYYRNDSSREVLQVYDIRDGRYYFTDNVHFSWSVKECDEKSHLWTIQDAKEGDVLAEDTCTFIIKKLNHDLTAKIYCCLHDDGDFELNSNLGFDDTCTYPATKEQRDLLFAKMKEAGYEWDAEKKESKKISQRMISAEAKEAMYDKPAWSEEDEKMFEHIIAKATLHFSSINYLDEEEINFLKSLRPQKQWKPTKEQMDALAWALSLAKNCGEECAFDLRTLQDQLKKLTEE